MKLVDVLSDSRFRPLFEDVTDVVSTAFLLPLRHRTTNIKVDIAIGLSGFERQTVERAETMSLGGTLVAVATAEDILIMKILAGRPQDEQDLHGIVMAQGEHLDWAYCLSLAGELEKALDQDLVSRVSALRKTMNAES